MFQAVGDLVTLKWIREHPLVTTSVAAASAAYSYAFAEEKNGEGAEKREEKSSRMLQGKQSSQEDDSDYTEKVTESNGRAISWGDERGGKLAEVMEEPQFEVDEPVTPPGRPVHKTKSMLLKPKLMQQESLATTSEADAISRSNSFESANTTDDDEEDVSEEGVTGARRKAVPPSPESPQWGWFVSMTPPQTGMYARNSKSSEESDS